MTDFDPAAIRALVISLYTLLGAGAGSVLAAGVWLLGGALYVELPLTGVILGFLFGLAVILLDIKGRRAP